MARADYGDGTFKGDYMPAPAAPTSLAELQAQGNVIVTPPAAPKPVDSPKPVTSSPPNPVVSSSASSSQSSSPTNQSSSSTNQSSGVNQNDPRWQRLYADAIRQQVASGSTATADQLRQAAKDAANTYYQMGSDSPNSGNDYATAIAGGSNVVPTTYNAKAGSGTVGAAGATGTNNSFAAATAAGQAALARGDFAGFAQAIAQMMGLSGSPTSSQYGSSLTPGSNSPFGTLMGDDKNALPLGLGIAWHQLLLSNIQNMASQSGYQYSYDPNANGGKGGYVQGGKTFQAQMQEAQLALQTTNNQLQEAALTGTINGVETVASKQLKQQADLFAQQMGFNQTQLAENIRQFNANMSFQQQQQQFTEANTLSQMAANPRTSIQAAMLGSTRGALGQAAAGDALAGLRAYEAALTKEAPGAAPGVPTTSTSYMGPDGRTITYNAAPTGNATTPIGAFTRAIMEGKAVPGSGDLGTTGGYVTTDQFRQAFDPNRIRLADFLRAAPSEQAQLAGAASYAGYSDTDLTNILSKFGPTQRSIVGGANYIGVR